MSQFSRKYLSVFSLSTLIVSTIIIVLAAEIMIRLFVPREIFWPISNIYKSTEIPGVVYMYKPNFEGIAFGVDIKTNSLGFRGPEWRKDKVPDTYRIALIGDSHAFGFGVPFTKTVGEKLARLLEKEYHFPVEVLNFGVNGYNSWQQKSVLTHLALDYYPDTIIILSVGNDHKPPLRADNEGWLHWDSNTGNHKSRIVDKSIRNTSAENTSWLMKNSLFLQYCMLMKKRIFNKNKNMANEDQGKSQSKPGVWMGKFPPGPVSERLRITVHQPLKESLELLREKNIPTIIASFNSILDYRQMYQNLSKEYNVPALELLSLFPETVSWDSLVSQFGLGWDSHLNAEAHRRWAVAMHDIIVNFEYTENR